MPDPRLRHLIYALYAFFGLGYSLLMPLWEAPDEPAHYRLALSLARERRFPSQEENYEAGQPRLYYALASVPLALLDAIDPAWTTPYNARVKPSLRDETAGGGENAWQRLARHEAFDGQSIFEWNDANYRFVPGPMLLRWLNLLLGALTCELCFRGARRIAPRTPGVAYAALALVALTPQLLHISASVGNDPLANCAGALLFYALCRAAVGPLSTSTTLGIATLAVVAPFVTKLTVLPIALATLVALLGTQRRRWTVAVAAAAAFGAAALVVASAGERPFESLWLRALYIRPDALGLVPEIATSFARSYWGAVGWMSVELPGRAFAALTLLAGIGVAGSLRWLGPPSAGRADLGPRRAWWLLWLALALTFAVAGKNALATLQAQGRYLFPSIGVIALLVTGGWCALWPRLARGELAWAVIGLMSALNLWMWLAGVLPAYYQPFLG